MEHLRDKYGNEIASWYKGGTMNDARMISIFVIMFFIAGCICGTLLTLSAKPSRVYMIERTIKCSDMLGDMRIIGMEDKVRYFKDGKEVSCKEYKE